jgi:pilus assembly protein CpaB
MTVAVFALLAGLAGAYVVRHHLDPQTSLPNRPASAATPDPIVFVPVALTDLEKDRELSVNDIAIMRFTREELAKSEYANQTYLPNSQQIQGRRLRIDVKKGELFAPDSFYPFGDTPGILERLQAGYRGVTVPVQNIGAVYGFARPGSFVDVLFRSKPEGRRSEVTLTLFERVEVLALDRDAMKRGGGLLAQVGSVTLAVTPQQAKILKVVEGRGELSLTLRHPDDDFQFAPFDPALERTISGLTDGAVVLPTAFPATAAGKASSGKAGAEVESIEGVDGIIGNAAERLTLADLLGITSEARQTKMEIYLGGTKSVLRFEEPENDAPELLRSGGRIRTPIVDFPKRRRPLGTAQLGN